MKIELGAELDLVRASTRALRLEQAPIYPSDVTGGALNAWLGGETDPLAPGASFDPGHPWFDLVATHAVAGHPVTRIRVHQEPPTPYQRWIRWAGALNVVAGERIGYVSRAVADAAGVSVASGDWWLLDDKLIVYTFDPRWSGTAELVDDGERLAAALTAWRTLEPLTAFDTVEPAR